MNTKGDYKMLYVVWTGRLKSQHKNKGCFACLAESNHGDLLSNHQPHFTQ